MSVSVQGMLFSLVSAVCTQMGNKAAIPDHHLQDFLFGMFPLKQYLTRSR
jgi:hypothetical protein